MLTLFKQALIAVLLPVSYLAAASTDDLITLDKGEDRLAVARFEATNQYQGRQQFVLKIHAPGHSFIGNVADNGNIEEELLDVNGIAIERGWSSSPMAHELKNVGFFDDEDSFDVAEDSFDANDVAIERFLSLPPMAYGLKNAGLLNNIDVTTNPATLVQEDVLRCLHKMIGANFIDEYALWSSTSQKPLAIFSFRSQDYQHDLVIDFPQVSVATSKLLGHQAAVNACSIGIQAISKYIINPALNQPYFFLSSSPDLISNDQVKLMGVISSFDNGEICLDCVNNSDTGSANPLLNLATIADQLQNPNAQGTGLINHSAQHTDAVERLCGLCYIIHSDHQNLSDAVSSAAARRADPSISHQVCHQQYLWLSTKPLKGMQVNFLPRNN